MTIEVRNLSYWERSSSIYHNDKSIINQLISQSDWSIIDQIVTICDNDCVQQTQQLSERSLLLVYSFRLPKQHLDLKEYINSNERLLNCWIRWTQPFCHTKCVWISANKLKHWLVDRYPHYFQLRILGNGSLYGAHQRDVHCVRSQTSIYTSIYTILDFYIYYKTEFLLDAHFQHQVTWSKLTNIKHNIKWKPSSRLLIP